MKTLLLSGVLITCSFGQVPEAKVSDRSKPIQVALEEALKKKCDGITAADLETVSELKLPHIHIPSFKDNDFAGLTKLKKLHFFSLFHHRGQKPNEPVAFNGKVFAPLSALEELRITDDQLGQLPDDAFIGLVSLKVLDLSSSTLPRLPTSILTLPKIETVYFDGRGMSKEDFDTLKKTLGDKHKNTR